jgi:hypothetical protein
MLSPATIQALQGVRGVAVNDGTRAVVFANGAVIADLTQGVFDFRQAARKARDPQRGANENRGAFGSFIAAGTAMASRLMGRGGPQDDSGTPGAPRSADAAPAAPAPPIPPSEGRSLVPRTAAGANEEPAVVSVLLVRQGPLPVIIVLQRVATATAATDLVLQIAVEIVDPLAFSHALLLSRRELGLKALAVSLTPIVESALRAELKAIPAEEIVPERALEQRLAAAMTGALTAEWSFLRIQRIVKIATASGEIQRLSRFRDATYFSDRALEQISARNEFVNRLRLAHNRERIQAATGTRALQAALQTIDQDGLVGADDLAKFELLLDHGRRLREATTEEAYQVEIAGLRKSELIREESLAILKREHGEHLHDHEGRRLHALALFDLSRQLEVDQARLHWEHQVGDQRIALEMERKLQEHLARYEQAALAQQEQRLADDYADERQRSADLRAQTHEEVQDRRDQRRRLSQLEIARQAQMLAESRQEGAHQRELAAASQRARDSREAERVTATRWVGMTPEQILAANPSLTPAGAAALAARYHAEAATATGMAVSMSPSPPAVARARDSAGDDLRVSTVQQLATLQDFMRATVSTNAILAQALVGGDQRPSGSPAGQVPGADASSGRAALAGSGDGPRATAGSAGAPRPSLSTAAPIFCSQCGCRLTALGCPACSPP